MAASSRGRVVATLAERYLGSNVRRVVTKSRFVAPKRVGAAPVSTHLR